MQYTPLINDIIRYDSRVKAMEVDERPTEEYGDIGGLDKQIAEVSLWCIALWNLLFRIK